MPQCPTCKRPYRAGRKKGPPAKSLAWALPYGSNDTARSNRPRVLLHSGPYDENLQERVKAGQFSKNCSEEIEGCWARIEHCDSSHLILAVQHVRIPTVLDAKKNRKRKQAQDRILEEQNRRSNERAMSMMREIADAIKRP